MIHIDLNEQEREILDETLQGYLSDLRFEIAGTDRKEFRDGLKAKKAVMRQ